jgi:transcriptional regulator with XRE-family HTH domain
MQKPSFISRYAPCMAAPTRAKRRLGAFLLELRTRAGKSTVAVAKYLKTADSTVSRYESGQVLPVWSTVLNLVNFYEGSAAEITTASQLWEEARDEAPPVRLPAGTPKSFRRLVNAEREAKSVRTIAPIVWPGLLQDESYAQALFAAGHRFHDPDTRVDGAINVRLNRQLRLQDPDFEYHAILDEGVVRRLVGGAKVSRKQLLHVLTTMELPNVTVQVVAFQAGAYGLSAGGCVIVDYPGDDDPPGVYLEYPAGGAWVENAKDVSRFTTMFTDATKAALSPSDTAGLLHQQLRALEIT